MTERMARIEADIGYIKEKTDVQNDKIDKFISSCEQRYATKQELETFKESFSATKILAYGFTGILVTAIITAIIIRFFR